jgi:sarcosine oxidase
LWREAERELGDELLWTTGGLDIGPPDEIAALSAVLSDSDVLHEILTPAQLADRFPVFRLPGDWDAIFQPDGGVLHADACRLGLTELARRAGATVLAETPALSIARSGDGVIVETPAGTWLADAVVVAAAGWTNRLVEPLGIRVSLSVTREHVAYYRSPHAAGMVPFIFREQPQRFHFYGLPSWRSGTVKVGLNASGPETSPDDDPVLDPAILASTEETVRCYLPSFGPEPESVETCLYASTSDDDFVMERIGPVVLGIGFGGHGYKFGAVIGSLLADLVEERPIPAASRFSYARFT